MADKKPTVKAHRGFIHIPRRGGPRRPIRPRRRNPVNLGNLGYFGRLPKGMQDLLLGGRRIVRPPRGPRRPRGPRVDPSPDIRRDPKKLRDFIRRQRERDRLRRIKSDGRPIFTPRPTIPDKLPPRRPQIELTPDQRALMQRQLRELENRRRRTTGTPTPEQRRRRTPQIAAGLGSLGSPIFNRAMRAQRRAKGGVIFKAKDYVNPSNTVDNKKK